MLKPSDVLTALHNFKSLSISFLSIFKLFITYIVLVEYENSFQIGVPVQLLAQLIFVCYNKFL